jgi:DNA-3-methyladenine glycosylase II
MPRELPPDVVRRSLRHLRRADPVLREVIERVGPFRMTLQTRRFESLARAIVAQQISGAAARSIWRKLIAAARSRTLTADALAALSDIELRACGVSPQKLSYLRDLHEKVGGRVVRLHRAHRLSDEDVIAELVTVKGIGVWTAQMFLMFSLGRPDVLPHQDLGIRAAIKRLYGLPDLPDRETCEEIAAPWRPHATVACWYLWRSGEGV